MTETVAKVYRKPTINDVAARANVSKSIVSHYINGRVNRCSEKTGQRILQAISELNFVPARSILHQQTRSTQTIGVCAGLPPISKEDFTYTFMHDFWSGLGSIADGCSYRILQFPYDVRFGKSCDAFLDGSIDGLLISPTSDDQRLETLARAGLPTVAISRWSGLPASIGSVWSEDSAAIDLAMDHLWTLGHRRIAHIAAGNLGSCHVGDCSSFAGDAAATRCHRYCSWLSEHDATENQLTISSPDWSPLNMQLAKEALSCMKERDNPATAVVCANDAIAASLLIAAPEIGMRIPHDLSVVGIDNNINCRMMTPPLTTVELPFLDIGREAMLMLHRMMSGQIVAQKRIIVPVTNLVVGGSTCAPDI